MSPPNENEWVPGLAYIVAAGIGGAVLGSRAQSTAVKILTPFAATSATSVYFFHHRNKQRRRHLVVDRTIASSALKQHDEVINRASMLGKNAEARAQKVLDNIVDASLPSSHQSRNEKHPAEIGRKALKSNQRQFEVTPDDLKVDIKVPQKVTTELKEVKKEVNAKVTALKNKTHDVVDDARAAASSAASSVKAAVAHKTTSHKPDPNMVVDRTIASEALKHHDEVVAKGSMVGKNTEERANKVLNSVVDASLPASRQSRHEKHPAEVGRKALASGQRRFEATPDDLAVDTGRSSERREPGL
ncbi:hypothetical protein BGZ94_001710 [Podila epigama]|nr:hypothetical protein BGZ94_001710 [Podila epigama]